MFDKVIIGRTHTEYVPYEKTVHEHRAPTDDSIKLYEEIKEKAYASILGSLTVTDNTLNIRAVIYDEILEMARRCKYKVLLNGKEVTGTVDIGTPQDMVDISGVYRTVVEAVGKKIAEEVCRLVNKDLMKMALWRRQG